MSSNSFAFNPLLYQFISRLKQLGIHLQVVDNRLKVRGNPRYLLPQIKRLLIAQKNAIIQLLNQSASVCATKSTSVINEPLAATPTIRLSVWEVTLSDGKAMTVLSRDEHTQNAMYKSMQKQFGSHRVAHITLRSCHVQ